MTQQYLRQVSLVVADDSGNGIELNQFSIKFSVHHSTFSFPHTANIRIYNLAPATQNKIGTEFTKLVLKAGYPGNFGVIFQGGIKQVRMGRESAVDGFTDIFAADGDLFHNFGVINATLPAGYTQQQVWQQISAVAEEHGVQAETPNNLSASPSPRGKVMYGLAREYVRDFSTTNEQLVTVDNGVLRAMPLLAYKQTDAIDINVSSGMVGVPEQTESGITVTTLLNPAIAWGSRVRINNADITQNLNSSWTYEGYAAQIGIGIPKPPMFPDVSLDGFYKVLCVDHVGATRDNEFYSCLICLSIDPSSAAHVPDAVVGLNAGI